MKLTTLIGLILIILFFALPILTGYAFLPEDARPHNIGEFLGGIFNYWIEVIKTVLSSIKR